MKIIDRELILNRLYEHEWPYASNVNPLALQEMTNRIARTGRLGSSLISYSNLVSGITFQFPNVQNNMPFVIDVRNWEGLHRRIVGDCLGYISFISYKEHDFMASSLVAGITTNKPSDIFFEWMKSLGAIENLTEKSIDEFWIDQVKKSVAWYKKNPNGFFI